LLNDFWTIVEGLL